MLAACLAAPAFGWAADGKKKSDGASDYAIVAGTVFRDNGLSLSEAEVTIEVAPEPGAPAPAGKSRVKKLKAITSSRGEFSFRVPPVQARYKVSVAAKGFQPADKVIEIQGGAERADATFSLSPESKH